MRFTAWLSPEEREAVRVAAREMNTSDNYIIRKAIRKYLKMESQEQPLLRVTSDTSGTEVKV